MLGKHFQHMMLFHQVQVNHNVAHSTIFEGMLATPFASASFAGYRLILLHFSIAIPQSGRILEYELRA